jgi:hypothetical protein
MKIIENSRGAPTHSQRLEKWLGVEAVDRLTFAMKDFYHPIAVHGVPGKVYAMPGGDFCGEIRAGQEMSSVDRALDIVNRERRAAQVAMRNRVNHPRFMKQHGAFASLSALIAAGTGGKGQYPSFQKTGTSANAAGNSNDLWTNSGLPAAGAAGAAAPGGTAWTNASGGCIGFTNPSAANTAHFVTGEPSASVPSNTLLLYDRLFSVAKTMTSTATQAVTGTFSRYQSGTATNANYIGGNFLFPSNPTTVLAATAHNWTVCQYTNQAAAAGISAPSIAGVSACVVHGIDLAAGSWFMSLAAGDVGVSALTQMQCSASVATGTIDFNVGHPIAFMPCPIAYLTCTKDGINTAFNLTSIFDNACLAFLEINKPATTATSYNGQLILVSE